MRKKIVVMCLTGLISTSALSSLPVVDIGNLYQNARMIITQTAQYRNQFEQYKNQIQQYKNMLENTKSLTNFQWDNANDVINNLLTATNTLDAFKNEAGGLKGYLDRFQTTEHYIKSPCFTGNCSKNELKRLNENRLQSSVAQKRANDAILKGIDKQQLNIKEDAGKLKTLQINAQSAEGQKQALQAASQLASNQSHQLLQIRGLLIAGQTAQATKDSAAANKDAIEDAGDRRFRSGTYHKSSGIKW